MLEHGNNIYVVYGIEDNKMYVGVNGCMSRCMDKRDLRSIMARASFVGIYMRVC